MPFQISNLLITGRNYILISVLSQHSFSDMAHTMLYCGPLSEMGKYTSSTMGFNHLKEHIKRLMSYIPS